MALKQNDDHQCHWREAVSDLQASFKVLESKFNTLATEVVELRAENVSLKEQLARKTKREYGRKSEKRPRAQKPKKIRSAEEKAESLEKRRARKRAQKELPSTEVLHKVEDSERICPECGKKRRAVGNGRVTEVIERITASLVRELHIQETLSCGCGSPPVQAKAPTKPIFGGRYGAGFLAHLVASKCADSVPDHRLEKILRREGIDVPKSTLNSLFHKVSDLVAPLVTGLRTLIISRDLVSSDETGIKVLNRKDKIKLGCSKAYFWVFVSLTDNLVYYACRKGKSQAVPKEIMEKGSGYLVCDGSGSYNSVTKRGNWIYCGCMAHARRRFFGCQEAFPEESEKVLDWIDELYAVEKEAKTKAIVGSPEHLVLRTKRSKPIIDELRGWLDSETGAYAPSEGLSKAITYLRNQWEGLTRFLEDPRIPIDNNLSERMLRRIGIGRKNWLFVANDEKGESLAGLYSLVMSAELCEINSELYLKDVLNNLDNIRPSNLEDWLPHKWKPPPD